MLIKKLIEAKKGLHERENLIPFKELEKKVKKELKRGNNNYVTLVVSQLSIRALKHIDELQTINDYINRILEIQSEHLSNMIEDANNELSKILSI